MALSINVDLDIAKEENNFGSAVSKCLKTFDLDGDGKLCWPDVVTTARNLHASVLVGMNAKDHTGSLALAKSDEDLLQSQFKRADLDKNGFVTKEELIDDHKVSQTSSVVRREAHVGRSEETSLAQKFMAHTDSDSDGMVSLLELKNAFHVTEQVENMFHAANSNHDQGLDLTEMVHFHKLLKHHQAKQM